MVASNHGDADAAFVTFLHRFDRLLSRWIKQADKTEQNERLRQIGGAQRAHRDSCIFQPSEAQYSFPLRGQPVRLAGKTFVIDTRGKARHRLLAVAMFKDDLRRAFDQQDVVALRGAMEGCHEFMFGFKRNSVNARESGELDLPVHTQLGREGIERPFSRVTLDLPHLTVLEQFGVVAQERHPPHEP